MSTCPSCGGVDGFHYPDCREGKSQGLFALVAVVVAIVGAMTVAPFVVALFPIAGLLAVGVAYGMNGAMAGHVNDVAKLFVIAVPCFIVFLLGLAVEQWAARWKAYRVVRHVIRVVGMGVATKVVVMPYLFPDLRPGYLPPVQIGIIAAVMVGTHVVFWWMGRRRAR